MLKSGLLFRGSILFLFYEKLDLGDIPLPSLPSSESEAPPPRQSRISCPTLEPQGTENE